MKKTVMSVVVYTAIIGSLNVASAAQGGLNILDNIKFSGELRPRYETVNSDKSSTTSAQSFTNRTHLVLTAGLFGVQNLSATIGLQSVNNFGNTNYSSPGNLNYNGDGVQYDIIADKQQAMLSEASIDYKLGKTALHAGRSQLNLDNQRFIGTVGWRQTERSYDTVYASNSDIENLDILAAYVYGYAGVTGITTTETNSVLLHVKYKVAEALSITAYDYMLASTSDTIGLALTGKIDAGAKLTYRAEYAIQRDATMEYGSAAAQTNVKADAYYYNLDIGANFSGFIAGLNYEVLSGKDENDATSTKTNFNPALGTNHKFNGWADVFYVGNNGAAGGLIDTNIRLGYKTKGFGKLLAVYHDFQAETAMNAVSGTTTNLGSEIDVVYVNKIPGVNNLTGLLKLASYTAGDATSFTNATFDKQVAWAQLSYKF
ncbi:MAG: alginate export family protein [Sulfurimonas sp.]|nr:alginate export family protein [Sulfurimonas sp.]